MNAKVTVQEVVEVLCNCGMFTLANRIQPHGIEVAYTPMTDYEKRKLYSEWFTAKYGGFTDAPIESFAWETHLEKTVLARRRSAQRRSVCIRSRD